jgi:hypothetical protein
MCGMAVRGLKLLVFVAAQYSGVVGAVLRRPAFGKFGQGSVGSYGTRNIL